MAQQARLETRNLASIIRQQAWPQQWRFRAEELRSIGESMADPGARASVFKLAQSYEEMAARWEGNQRDTQVRVSGGSGL